MFLFPVSENLSPMQEESTNNPQGSVKINLYEQLNELKELAKSVDGGPVPHTRLATCYVEYCMAEQKAGRLSFAGPRVTTENTGSIAR